MASRRSRPARRTAPRPPGRRLVVLATTAATGALAASLLTTGGPAGSTALAAEAPAAVLAPLGDRGAEEASSRGVLRDASAIQELNDPDGPGAEAGSPQAASALAQDQTRAQALLAAAAREAQAAQQAVAAAAPPAPAGPAAAPAPAARQPTAPPADDGAAGPAAYRAYARSRIGAAQFGCLDSLWNRESGWRPAAQNPHSSAYGIPQLLTATWAATGISRTSNGYRQVDAGLVYLAAAYGTPCAAWAHEKAYGWY